MKFKITWKILERPSSFCIVFSFLLLTADSFFFSYIDSRPRVVQRNRFQIPFPSFYLGPMFQYAGRRDSRALRFDLVWGEKKDTTVAWLTIEPRFFLVDRATLSCNLFVILMKHESGRRVCCGDLIGNSVIRSSGSVARSRELFSEINSRPDVKCSW